MKVSKPNLTPNEVQEIRALHRSGFTATSIASLYNVTIWAVTDIIKFRTRYRLPVAEVALPLITPDQAKTLRLRNSNNTSYELQKIQDAYRITLASQLPESDREAFAESLLGHWIIDRPLTATTNLRSKKLLSGVGVEIPRLLRDATSTGPLKRNSGVIESAVRCKKKPRNEPSGFQRGSLDPT